MACLCCCSVWAVSSAVISAVGAGMSSVSPVAVGGNFILSKGCQSKNAAGPTQGWCGLWNPAAMKNGLSRFCAIN